MGCYISGTVHIGHDDTSVNNVVVQYCNLNSVNVYGPKCTGTTVNQNYIRSYSDFNSAEGTITNNIAHSFITVNGGHICNNIIVKNVQPHGKWPTWSLNADNCTIANNILLEAGSWGFLEGYNDTIYNNMQSGDFGDDPINVDGAAWTDVFDNYVGITPASNFHFKEAYKEYEGKVGIYAGDSFSETGLPPVPFIVAKSIPQQTDASGKLNIKIRVKASE